MVFAFIIFLILFIILGILFFFGLVPTSFLSGGKKNDGTEHEVDGKKIGRFLGVVMFFLALSALVGLLGYTVKGADWLVICAPIMFIVVLIIALIYANGDKRFAPKNQGRRYK